MVYVGIDVAKDKHDCCILDSDGIIRADCFTIPNNMDGLQKAASDDSKLHKRVRQNKSMT